MKDIRKYPIKVAVDQHVEQTKNKDAKTSIGIKNFIANKFSVYKRCLNRADRTETIKY